MSSVLSLRILKTLHSQVRELAEEEGVSMNQFVMLALAEKVAAL
jgi:predicted HicB family RNase H-like nuclease